MRFYFKVFLLILAISICLIWICSSKYAVISLILLICAYERDVLRDKWVDTVGVGLAICDHVIWRYGLLLSLNIWIRVKLSVLGTWSSSLNTTLISELVIGIRMTKTTSESRWHSSSWKSELLAKRWDMRQTCLAFFIALVKNTIRLFSNFWANVSSLILSRSLYGWGVILLVVSGGTSIYGLLESFELDSGRTTSLWNIDILFMGVRCCDLMSQFLNIMRLLVLIKWCFTGLNNLNFRSDKIVLITLIIIIILLNFLIFDAARMRRKIWIFDCVLVMVWYLSLSLRLGNWLLNSCHSFTDLKIDQYHRFKFFRLSTKISVVKIFEF